VLEIDVVIVGIAAISADEAFKEHIDAFSGIDGRRRRL
jgi:hypothetical protein